MILEGSYVLERAHGVVVLGHIDALIATDRPHEEERACAAALGGERRRAFLGGRAAIRAALSAAGLALGGPILRSPRGAPSVSGDVRASISHKTDVVVALVARGAEGEHVGVDLEEERPLRVDIARKVLTARELAELPSDGAARDAAVRRAFSVKEAIYKAIDPVVGRYVGFHEVELPFVDGGLPAAFDVDVALRTGERLDVAATWELPSEIGGLVLTTARARARSL